MGTESILRKNKENINKMNAFDKVYFKILTEAIGYTSYYNARNKMVILF